MKATVRSSMLALLGVSSPALAALGEGTTWLPWLVLGAVGLFVLGIALRMFIAARFPEGYKAWAARRRDAFAANTDAWDREDDEFRR